MREMYRLTPWRLEKNWIVGAGCHPIDAVRWFLGDILEIHAFGSKGKVSDYTGMDNFTINMKFTDGIIARVLLLIGAIESPEPMMKISVFGNKGSGFATHTDNKGGVLETVLDKNLKKPVARMDFPPEHGLDIYGHTNTIIRYMKYFEDCLTNDTEPSPNAVDGAKTLIASESVILSIRDGKVIKIDNEILK
jgi:predicted dehydrogenase